LADHARQLNLGSGGASRSGRGQVKSGKKG
jgi:hypothetical protein